MPELMSANREVVVALCNHLVASFEEFASMKGRESDAGLSYVDALMGCHNFYKAIILDLEQRCPRSPISIRQIAIDTLTQALLKDPR